MDAALGADATFSYAARIVPTTEAAVVLPLDRPPAVGDLAVAEVVAVGAQGQLEGRSGAAAPLFPGDTIVGVFGNRSAADQYEGHVPTAPVAECHLLSAGGVLGTLVSRHALVPAPARLRLLGLAADRDGQPLTTLGRGLAERPAGEGHGGVILVVGSAAGAGKTTTAGAIVRALAHGGAKVAAAKVTGATTGSELRYLKRSGAAPVLDVGDAGYPSTYGLDPDGLLRVWRALLSTLRASAPDYTVVEVADGLLQRETAILLDAPAFRDAIDHVVLAVADSMSGVHGARLLRARGLPLRAVSGTVTRSVLAMREVEEVSGVPYLGPDRMVAGELPGVPVAAGHPPAAVATTSGATAAPAL